jgi:hypothetical protein
VQGKEAAWPIVWHLLSLAERIVLVPFQPTSNDVEIPADG